MMRKINWDKHKIKKIGFHFQGIYHTAVFIPGKHRQVFCDNIKIDVMPPGMKKTLNQAIARHN